MGACGGSRGREQIFAGTVGMVINVRLVQLSSSHGMGPGLSEAMKQRPGATW